MDFVCLDDLDPAAAEMTDPVAELEQDSYHRLICPHGMNIDDPDFGLGLEEMLSGVVDPSLASRIKAELRKDSRVDDVSTVVTVQSQNPLIYRITIEIKPQGSLILEANAADATLRRVA